MTKHARDISFAPRLMKEAEAATYLGRSITNLRQCKIPRRIDGGLKLYDRLDLDAYASSLKLEGEDKNPCDEIFGVGS